MTRPLRALSTSVCAIAHRGPDDAGVCCNPAAGLALRRELEAAGSLQQSWQGHSDTETLLASIEAWGLPLAMKIRPGKGSGGSKWALRQLLHRYVPPALIERPKAGFAMPIGAWLRGPLRSWAEDLLDPQLLQRQGYLQSEPIWRLWRAHLRGADHTPQLWSVLMWQAWLAGR